MNRQYWRWGGVMAMDNAPPPRPFKRKVFYLSGYDPRGARCYHGILAEEVAKEAARGRHFELSRRAKCGANVGWNLHSEGGACQGDHEFLVWDDIVRDTWAKLPPGLLWQGLRAYWYLCRNHDAKLARRWPRVVHYTLFMPGVLFILLPVLFALLLWAGMGLVMPPLLALPLALVAGWGGALWLQKRLHSLWLLRFVIFSTIFARREVEGLDERLDSFVERIDAALSQDWDEVLLIAHSAGTILSMQIMAQLLNRRGGGMPPHFALVTLGGVIQLMPCRRDAAWLGGALDTVAAGRFCWLDIASITDGACVPLVPPCLGREREAPDGLVQITPRWFVYCEPTHYARRRRDKHMTHFDYLRRLDHPSPLDYLGLVAAPRPLAASVAEFEAQRHG